MEKQRDNHIEQNVTEQHTTEQGGIYRKRDSVGVAWELMAMTGVRLG